MGLKNVNTGLIGNKGLMCNGASIEQPNHSEREPSKIILEAFGGIGKNRLAFRKMLEICVPSVGYSIPKNPKILNLGCGECYEGVVLNSYFGGEPEGYDSDNVTLVGIDNDPEQVDKAKALHRKFEHDNNGNYIGWNLPSNYIYIQGDARDLDSLVDGYFDIIVARHPNVCQIPNIWTQIFGNSKDYLKQDGMFISTSFSDVEHQILEQLVKEVGYNILLSKSNPYAISTSNKEVSIDRKVLFAKKD